MQHKNLKIQHQINHTQKNSEKIKHSACHRIKKGFNFKSELEKWDILVHNSTQNAKPTRKSKSKCNIRRGKKNERMKELTLRGAEGRENKREWERELLVRV